MLIKLIQLQTALLFFVTCANSGSSHHKNSLVESLAKDGWQIENQVTGDINQDSQEDWVLSLTNKVSNASTDDLQSRRLVILQKTDAGYATLLTSDTVLPCQSCLGMMGGSPVILLQNDRLKINWLGGSREVVEVDLDFQFYPDRNAFYLVTAHRQLNDRVTGESHSRLDQYIQGIQVVDGVKKQVPSQWIKLQDVNYEDYL